MRVTLLFLCLSYQCNAQIQASPSDQVDLPNQLDAHPTTLQSLPIDPNTGKVTFTEIVNGKNSKEMFHKNVRAWAAQNYTNYKSAVQIDDEATGRLVLQANSSVRITSPMVVYINCRLNYVLTIDSRAGKYRATITDFTYQNMDSRNLSGPISLENTLEAYAIALDKRKAQATTSVEEKERVKLDYYIQELEDKITTSRQTYLRIFSSLKKQMLLVDDF